MKNEAFIEKYVSTIRKNCFFWQRNQKWFPLAVKYFFLKIVPPIISMVFNRRKKSLNRNILLTEKKFPLTGMKDYFRWQ